MHVDLEADHVTSQPTLPANRAFLVQFRAPAPEGSPACDGRVEHVVSGETAHFHSWEALRAFMTDVLTSVPQPTDPE